MPQDVIEVTQREVEIIEVIERGPVGQTGPQPDINYTVVSSARTLEAADLIAADTSGGAFTLTLPLNPSDGDAVDIFDFSETFDTNPLTIARNGSRIESLEENLVCNVEGAYFTLIYTGSTRGWQVVPRFGGGSGGGGELTTEGDLLYRGPSVNERLGIGTAGQILKVNSTATAPEWGAAPDSIDDYTVVTANQTVVNGARIAADTNGGSFTLTLPATPQGGDTVYILDYASTFDTNNLILARNGSNIEGLAENMTCNVEGSSFKMVFTGASTGWQMIPYYGTGVAIGSNATDVLSLSSGQIVADDPAADRLVFWDDSESKLTYLQAGSGLTISGTTISASGGDTVTIDASAADILSATSGAISADDAGSDKIVFWDDSESKLAYGSVGDVGAAAASHTHDASAITSGTLNNDRVNFAAPPAIGNTTPNTGAFTTLAANNGTLTASAPVLDLAQTWNASGVTFTGMRFNVTNTSSGSESGIADFQVGGTTQIRLRRDGYVLCNGITSVSQAFIPISGSGSGPRFSVFNGFCLNRSADYYGWNDSASITSGSTGDLRLFRDAADTFAQRRDTNPQTFRLYNTVSGTANVNFERANFRWASNEFIIDAQAGGTGTLRGIKIGSATSSLLGFYGVTPVDQPATVADPAGGGTVDAEARTAINDIIDRLQELGLIA